MDRAEVETKASEIFKTPEEARAAASAVSLCRQIVGTVAHSKDGQLRDLELFLLRHSLG